MSFNYDADIGWDSRAISYDGVDLVGPMDISPLVRYRVPMTWKPPRAPDRASLA